MLIWYYCTVRSLSSEVYSTVNAITFFMQGELLCLQSDCGLLAMDFDFAGKSAESLINFKKLESTPAGITAFGKSSTVWKAEVKVETQ